MSISQKSRGRSPFVEMPSWAVTVSASALSFPSQTSSRSLSKSERRHRHNRLGCLRVAAFASRCLCTHSKARFTSCSPRGGRGSQNSPCLNHKPPAFKNSFSSCLILIQNRLDKQHTSTAGERWLPVCWHNWVLRRRE